MNKYNLYFSLVVVLWFAVIALYLSSAGTKVYMINYDHADIGKLQTSRLKNETPPGPPSQCLYDNNCYNPDTGA